MNTLHHISLLTGDLPATLAFYRDQLGMRLVKNTVNQENLHMRHVFFGDAGGSPGTVITFFEVSHLGPRYDDGAFMQTIDLAIPINAGDYWQQRLGSLTLQDPNGVTITLTPSDLPLTPQATISSIPAPMQVRGLLASELQVPDIPATLHFFATMLDAPQTKPEIKFADGRFLRLSQAHAGTHRFGRGSIDHIAISVADRAELKVMQQRATAAGFTIEKYADRGWFQSLYILEPNGNRIEFATPTPGFTLDQTIAELGHGLGLPPHLEGKRQALVQYWANQGVLFNEPVTDRL